MCTNLQHSTWATQCQLGFSKFSEQVGTSSSTMSQCMHFNIREWKTLLTRRTVQQRQQITLLKSKFRQAGALEGNRSRMALSTVQKHCDSLDAESVLFS